MTAVTVLWASCAVAAAASTPAQALVFSSPQLIDPGHALTAVSCPASTLCVAVDDRGAVVRSRRPLDPSARWLVTPITIAPLDAGPYAGPEGLTNISCPTTRFCAASGESETFISRDPGAARPTWRLVSRAVGEVSCQSTHRCVGINGFRIVTTRAPQAPTSWQRGPRSQLNFVAATCPSRSTCIAIDELGDEYSSSDAFATGAHWRRTSLPSGTNTVTALTCLSAIECVVSDDGGDLYTSSHPTAAGAWRAETVDAAHVFANADFTEQTGLEGVGCAAAGDCLAVDSVGGVLERDGGGPWQRHPLGGPLTAADQLDLYGIGCGPGFCVALDLNGRIAVGASTRPAIAGPRCREFAAAAVATGGQLIAYALNGPLGRGAYFACRPSDGTTAYLASRTEYGDITNDTIVGDVTLAGAYAAAGVQSGLDGYAYCEKYAFNDGPCTTPDPQVVVVDVARRARGVLPPTGGQISSLTVSPGGAVAWLQDGGSQLVACALTTHGAHALRGSPRIVATGAIDPASLRFNGLTLSWTVAGVSASLALD